MANEYRARQVRTDDRDWYAFRVPPQKEVRISHILRNKGYTVAVPLKNILRRKNRYAKSRTYVAKAIMPSYVLIAFDAGTFPIHELREMHFIKGVVCINGRPAKLNSGQVYKMLSNERAGVYTDNEVYKNMWTEFEYRTGDIVDINWQGFDNVRGKVTDITEKMATVKIPILSSEYEVEVPVDKLYKAG
ncbi:hypothetical protein KUV46_15770 [Thalassovita mediterranea]|nr:hypothetical protein KUV46_15770 [Thalassovita mediterranea]